MPLVCAVHKLICIYTKLVYNSYKNFMKGRIISKPITCFKKIKYFYFLRINNKTLETILEYGKTWHPIIIRIKRVTSTLWTIFSWSYSHRRHLKQTHCFPSPSIKIIRMQELYQIHTPSLASLVVKSDTKFSTEHLQLT